MAYKTVEVILCQEVRELHTFYIYIYIFCIVSKEFITNGVAISNILKFCF